MSSTKNTKSTLPGANQQKAIKFGVIDLALDKLGIIPNESSKIDKPFQKVSIAKIGNIKNGSFPALLPQKTSNHFGGTGKFGQSTIFTTSTSDNRFPIAPVRTILPT